MSSLELSIDNNNNNQPSQQKIKLREKKAQRFSPLNSPTVTSFERPIGIIEIKSEDQDTKSAESKNSKTRPVKITSEFSSCQNSDDLSQEPVQKQEEYTKEDLSLYFHNRNPTLDLLRNQQRKKSDSLDSASQACCTKLAFNIYNKALDSAKKHLPKNKQKNRYSGGFPRSFGEDFHSLGPEGFYYLDDSQTECSVDYRDIEFSRDSFLFNGSEAIPELLEEEFSQNKLKLKRQTELLHMDSTPEKYEIAHVSMKSPSRSPPRIPENTPLSSVENLPMDVSSILDLKPEVKRKSTSSLFERIFKRDKRNGGKTSKARSEPREIEREKSFRAISLPPPSFSSKCPSPPVMKIGEDGKLWFEHKKIPEPPGPNEAILSNIIRQSPIKLVYKKPPEIIVQEVTNLAETVDTLPQPKSSTPTSLGDVAEKTMMDILDGAIRQLQEEDTIPIYTNQNLPESIIKPSLDKNLKKKAPKKKNPILKRHKPNSIKLTKPKFLKKFEKKPEAQKVSNDQNPRFEVTDLKRNAEISQDSFVPQIIEKTRNTFEMQSNELNDMHVEEPLNNEASKLDGKSEIMLKKSKNFFKEKFPTAKIRLRKGRKNTKDNSKKVNGKISSLKESSQKLFSPSKRRPFKRQDRLDSENEIVRKKSSRLPQIPESQSSTLESHLYEGINGGSPLQTPQLRSKWPLDRQKQSSGDPMAIEIEIGIPLDAPYEELDEPSTSTGISLYHRYPDDVEMKHLPEPSQVIKQQNIQQKLNLETKTSLNNVTNSLVFDKTPDLSKFSYNPPEIIVKIPENAKLDFDTRNASTQNNVQTPESSSFIFSKHDIPDVAMMEPEFILSRPGTQIREPSRPSSLVTVQSKPDVNVVQKFPPQLEELESIKENSVTYQLPEDIMQESISESKVKPMNESMKEKVDKLRNIAGSFGQSFKTKMKDLIQKKPTNQTISPSSSTSDAKVIDVTIKLDPEMKETDLDQQVSNEMNSQLGFTSQPELLPIDHVSEEPSVVMKELDNILNDYRVDTTVDDEEHIDTEVKGRKKFVRKFPKFEFKYSGGGQSEPKDPNRPTFSQKNRDRFEQIRSRAQKSFNQLTDKLKQQKQNFQGLTRSIKAKSPPPSPSPYCSPLYDPYQYDLHFASDSEISPGTGVDSLRRSKVFKELADTQERLEMYMSPVDRHEPRRPPRRKASGQIREKTIYNHSLPSLTMVEHDRISKPPRPPPPCFTTSCRSVPFSISVIPPCEEEISLGTSTSSLLGTNRGSDNGKRQRFPRRQRCPPDMFYKNVRLGYRPKKSYVELLQKSQPFYSMITQKTLERSYSTGQLYGCRKSPAERTTTGFPVAPLRKSRTLREYDRLKSKPPIYPPLPGSSRATSVTSNCSGHYPSGYNSYTENDYEPPTNLNQILFEKLERKTYKPYLQSLNGTLKSSVDLNWEPYTWRVKRCRSFTEIEVRERLSRKFQQQHPPVLDEEPSTPDSTDTIVPSSMGKILQRSQRAQSTQPNLNYRGQIHTVRECVPKRVFRWSSLNKLMDSWRQRILTNTTKNNESSSHRPILPILMSDQATSPTLIPINTNFNSSTSTFNVSNNSFSNMPSNNQDQNYYYYNNNIDDFLADNSFRDGSRTPTNQQRLSPRPLPPPPVPPRPRLIPAHYAGRNRPKTHDVACDTSEIGFKEFFEEQQKTKSFHAKDRNRKSQSIDKSNENDDEITLVGNHKQKLVPNGSICSKNTLLSDNNTIGSVYLDARSNQSSITDNNNQPQKHHSLQHPWSGSDDDTINDDLSSLSSSQYQSVLDHLSPAGSMNYLPQSQQLPLTKNYSPQQQIMSSNITTTTDDYHTADDCTPIEQQQSADGNHHGDVLQHFSSSQRSSMNISEYYEDENNQENYDRERFQQFDDILMQMDSKGSIINEPSGVDRTAGGNHDDDLETTKQQSTKTDEEQFMMMMSKDNKNRQSCISTESAESTTESTTSSTSSNTFSYSFESNKSLPIQINQNQSDENRLEVDEDISASIASKALTTAEVIILDGKDKKNNTKKISSNDKSDLSCFTTSSSTITCQLPLNPALRENLSSLPKSTPKGSKPDKRYYCAHEFYTTERDYVDVLAMLTKEFQNFIRPYVTPKWLDTFFRPLDVVTPINERLLEELRQRILVDWDDNPKLSDIINQICPYFKEYSIYIREFDRINLMLDDAVTRFDDFDVVLKSFENSDRCRKLTIKSYLLKPIQRLPQYRLMLSQYIKLLDQDQDEDEYKDTQKAMKVVSEVVEHIERESVMAERSLTLNELRNRIILTRPTKIVIPGRVLIRRGQLDKVSRKEVHVRYFILFNDVLFYLTPVMNGMYKLKEELPLLGMQVELSPTFPTEFIVRSVKRSFALLTRDEKEREEWVRDLRGAIADYIEKQQSFKNRQSTTSIDGSSPFYQDSDVISATSSPQSTLQRSTSVHQRSSIMSTESGYCESNNPEFSTFASNPNTTPRLGDLAPVWLHDNRVTMCHSCTTQFTFLNRRHHCRACGQIFCADCSSHQYPLKYLGGKSDRVCDDCYEELSNQKSLDHPCSGSPILQKTPNLEEDFSQYLKDESVKDESHNNNINTEDQHQQPAPPIIRVSVSPQDTIKSLSSNAPTNLFLSRKNRSNSCHELRNNQVKMPLDSCPSLLNNPLLRNNNIRLSSRLKHKNVSSVLVEVSANDPKALISGWLYRYAQKKGWKRYWFVIKNMVLYTFKASEDVRALETLPLPGYEVSISEETIKGYPAEFTIKLTHRCRSTIYFFTETKDNFKRWFECFKESSLLQSAGATSTLSTSTEQATELLLS